MKNSEPTKGELTKAKIIESGTLLFYKDGFENLLFSKIAKELNISQQAVYKYFESKCDLLSSCCLASVENARVYVVSQIDPMDLPEQQLKSYIKANIEWFSQNRIQAHSLLSMYYFSQGFDKIRLIKSEIENRGIDNISVLIRHFIKTKNIDKDQIHLTAKMIHSLLAGEFLKIVYSKQLSLDKNLFKNIEKAVLGIVTVMLKAEI